MENVQKLTDRESLTFNIMKAFAILSVITAHVVPVTNVNLLSNLISSFWCLFGEVGVIIFFVIGGYFYHRETNDGRLFWKKKRLRILLPWLFCSTITFAVAVVLGRDLNIISYCRWILGSGTWYYYITIYISFLAVFKWFYNKDRLLWSLIIVQILSLLLASFGKTTTIPLAFFTDYLNPFHWIGYFSLGIIIKKYRLDLVIRKRKDLTAVAYLFLAVSLMILYFCVIFTYFHIVSSVFCLSALVIVFDLAYRVASKEAAKYIGTIGSWSYCIYLLHMQIVQGVISRIPDSILKLLLSPFVGLGIMLVLIYLGLQICKRIQCGMKIKALVGL